MGVGSVDLRLSCNKSTFFDCSRTIQNIGDSVACARDARGFLPNHYLLLRMQLSEMFSFHFVSRPSQPSTFSHTSSCSLVHSSLFSQMQAGHSPSFAQSICFIRSRVSSGLYMPPSSAFVMADWTTRGIHLSANTSVHCICGVVG